MRAVTGVGEEGGERWILSSGGSKVASSKEGGGGGGEEPRSSEGDFFCLYYGLKVVKRRFPGPQCFMQHLRGIMSIFGAFCCSNSTLTAHIFMFPNEALLTHGNQSQMDIIVM